MIFWFLIVFIEQVLRQGVSNDLIPDWLIGVNQVSQIQIYADGYRIDALNDLPATRNVWRQEGVGPRCKGIVAKVWILSQ